MKERNTVEGIFNQQDNNLILHQLLGPKKEYKDNHIVITFRDTNTHLFNTLVYLNPELSNTR